MRTHLGGIEENIEETSRRHRGDIELYWEVQSIAIIVPSGIHIVQFVDQNNNVIEVKKVVR